MNKLTKNSFFSKLSGGDNKSSPSINFASLQAKQLAKQQPVAYEVFKEHWKHVNQIFAKSLINDDDIQIVKNNLNQMINLLLDELNNPNNYLSLKPLAYTNPSSRLNSNNETDYGPIWNFLFRHNILESVYLWSLSYPEYLFDLKYEQLKYYENLVYQMQTNEQTHLLLNVQIHRPLFSLLNHCSTHNSEQIEKLMISILNQLCVCICKNADLLEIFFQQAKMVSNANNKNNNSNDSSANLSSFYMNDLNDNDNNSPFKLTTHFSKNKQFMQPTSSARFFIFSLLIPYIHKEGALGGNCGSLTYGQQARDALLMIMQLSMRNVNLAKYIVDSTDFCPILATGLSGLYSELPQKLTSNENFDEIRYLKKDDIINLPSLNKFINSLEFCNNVIQVSHSLIANQLLQYVYYGFLIPVIAPALTQDVDNLPIELVELEGYVNCIDEIIAATAYLDLFLRTVTEPNLRKIFLKFILFAKFDEKITLLDALINRISSNTRLSLVTLMLFYTMIDFNSEDVMYKLILAYLIPCNHLMKSQILNLKESSYEINGTNANTFLSFSSNYNKPVWLESSRSNILGSNGTLLSVINQKEPTSFARWFYSLFENNDFTNTVSYLDSSHFNFVDYLKDAQNGISNSTQISLRWSYFYDTSNYSQNTIITSDNIDSSSQNPFNDEENINNNMIIKPGNQPSHELDYDAEEYLLNLNIFASSLSDPIKTNRTTQNLLDSLTTQEDYDTNIDVKDFKRDFKRGESYSSDINPLTNNTDYKSNKIKRKLKKNKVINNKKEVDPIINKENSVPIDTNNINNKKTKRQRVRQKRRERTDFYFLSFDNDLSDSGSSSSSSESEDILNKNKDHIIPVKIDKDEDDEDETDQTNSMTDSRSSSITLNNDTNSIKSVDMISLECRQKLIEYLFINEENNKMFLNGNLTSFLDALDIFFSENNKISIEKNSEDLNVICDQIMNIYNELFTIQSSDSNNEQNKETYNNKDTPKKTDSITHFPVYATDSPHSLHSSSHSLNNENGVDSGYIVESSVVNGAINNDSPSSKEIDIGPFLTAIFDRLDHMLSNPLQINFLLTGILARLAYYPQILIRSFFLNHNLVVQPNVQTLIQVMKNVKYKIDACSETFNNFPLLYFKAKVTLVRRILDAKSKSTNSTKPINQMIQEENSQEEIKTAPRKSSGEIRFHDLVRKNSTFNRFINFLKNKTDEEKAAEFLKQDPGEIETNIDSGEIETNIDELDLNDVKSNNTEKKSDNIILQARDAYSLVENEWENLETRNIAYSSVIFDEFSKELAAICQEHGLST